jgi:septal ring factor EnvC (AmiA/AmiB activator)
VASSFRNLEGRVEARFVIARDGKATKVARVGSSAIPSFRPVSARQLAKFVIGLRAALSSIGMRPLPLLLLLLLGCDNSAEERVKLAEQQKQTEQKIAKAEQEAKAKVADAQREMERLKTELGEAKVKLEEVTKNQAAAVADQKQVEAALDKAKKAYRALVKDELDELNNEAKELSAKAAKAPAATKAATTKTLQQVSTKQKEVAQELGELDKATLETLDSVKAKLDKELAALRASVRSAKAKLP